MVSFRLLLPSDIDMYDSRRRWFLCLFQLRFVSDLQRFVMTGIYGVDRCDWIYKYYEHHLIFRPVNDSSLNSSKYTSRLTAPVSVHSPSVPVSQGPSNPHHLQTQPYHLDSPFAPRDEHRQSYSARGQVPSC